jgi:hypothetical protein
LKINESELCVIDLDIHKNIDEHRKEFLDKLKDIEGLVLVSTAHNGLHVYALQGEFKQGRGCK